MTNTRMLCLPRYLCICFSTTSKLHTICFHTLKSIYIPFVSCQGLHRLFASKSILSLPGIYVFFCFVSALCLFLVLKSPPFKASTMPRQPHIVSTATLLLNQEGTFNALFSQKERVVSRRDTQPSWLFLESHLLRCTFIISRCTFAIYFALCLSSTKSTNSQYTNAK
jgi:hypothetical protein